MIVLTKGEDGTETLAAEVNNVSKKENCQRPDEPNVAVTLNAPKPEPNLVTSIPTGLE